MTFLSFDNKDVLVENLGSQICEQLNKGITTNGKASLLVSGGSTPVPLFQYLSQQDLDWSKVVVSLIDDRWVEKSSDASNAKLVQEHLLQNNASKACFVELVDTSMNIAEGVSAAEASKHKIPTPYDVVVLGMGEDGHTASLFPCSEEIQQGLDLTNTNTYIATQPTTAPHQRISLTLSALMQSKNTFLHLTGDSKKAVYEKAMSGDDIFDMPIRAVLQKADVIVAWAP